jgi:hypothetical protein
MPHSADFTLPREYFAGASANLHTQPCFRSPRTPVDCIPSLRFASPNVSYMLRIGIAGRLHLKWVNPNSYAEAAFF